MSITINFSARPHQVRQLIEATGGDDQMTLADALDAVVADIDAQFGTTNPCPRCLTQGTTAIDEEQNCPVCYGVGYTEVAVSRSNPVFTPVSPPPIVFTP